MLRFGAIGSALVLSAALVCMVPADVNAQASKGNCVNKAGEGTNTTQDGAQFQAYEAILQATDWGMWSAWMASSQKVGVAPGYKVSNLKTKCGKGGLGFTCRVQATLCS
jgi:hypothetical protein